MTEPTTKAEIAIEAIRRAMGLPAGTDPTVVARGVATLRAAWMHDGAILAQVEPRRPGRAALRPARDDRAERPRRDAPGGRRPGGTEAAKSDGTKTPGWAPSAVRPTEAQVQAQIVDGLRALGYEVLVTSARSARRGYGADHGVPDVLVSLPNAGWLGIEVKRPGAVRWSHPRQRQLWEARRTAVARSFEEACYALWTLAPHDAVRTPGGDRVRRHALAVQDAGRGSEVVFDGE